MTALNRALTQQEGAVLDRMQEGETITLRRVNPIARHSEDTVLLGGVMFEVVGGEDELMALAREKFECESRARALEDELRSVRGKDCCIEDLNELRTLLERRTQEYETRIKELEDLNHQNTSHEIQDYEYKERLEKELKDDFENELRERLEKERENIENELREKFENEFKEKLEKEEQKFEETQKRVLGLEVELKTKEDALKTQEEELRNTLKTQEEVLKTQEEALKSKEEVLMSKEEALKTQEEALKAKEDSKEDALKNMDSSRLDDASLQAMRVNILELEKRNVELMHQIDELVQKQQVVRISLTLSARMIRGSYCIA